MIRCHKCGAVLNTCDCDWPKRTPPRSPNPPEPSGAPPGQPDEWGDHELQEQNKCKEHICLECGATTSRPASNCISCGAKLQEQRHG